MMTPEEIRELRDQAADLVGLCNGKAYELSAEFADPTWERLGDFFASLDVVLSKELAG